MQPQPRTGVTTTHITPSYTATAAADTRQAKKLPEKKFRAGAVSATIWKNAGKDKSGNPVDYHSVSFERSFLDASGTWKTTHSLRLNDLPRANVVLSKAYEYLVLRNGNESRTVAGTAAVEEMVV